MGHYLKSQITPGGGKIAKAFIGLCSVAAAVVLTGNYAAQIFMEGIGARFHNGLSFADHLDFCALLLCGVMLGVLRIVPGLAAGFMLGAVWSVLRTVLTFVFISLNTNTDTPFGLIESYLLGYLCVLIALALSVSQNRALFSSAP